MRNILNYLKDAIDEKASLERWNAKKYLNLQLAGNYEYYLVTIFAEAFLLIKPIEMQSIQRLRIHILRIQEKVKYDVAVLIEEATPYTVKKMLEERIAFITVDRQLYLPFLALHIRKIQKKKMENEIREKFTASTQMIFLALLYSEEAQFGAEELAKKLNVSTMTVLRAFDELKRIGVVNYEIGGQTGRKKIIRPIEKKEYYRIGKDYLINPVKRSVNVSHIPENLKAYKCGLTALGEQTMLAEPTREKYAVYGNVKEVLNYQRTRAEALSEDLPEVQIMQYDISKLTENQYVDPITMILSLGQIDERVEIAVDEFMEGTEWYEA
ncbi:HTH domain-containing protein [Roseburia hominis]